ncbi:MAG: Gldg family protein [SAR324 cluster bacterium]|nr:Gldg family protein [SAR324 cluster bacterium]
MSPVLRRFVRLPAPLGGVAMYLGERALEGHPLAPYLTALGVALLVITLVLLLWSRAGGDRVALTLEAIPVGFFLLAALLYLVAREFPHAVLGYDLLTWGWVLSLLLGVFPYLFVELSLWSQGHPELPLRGRLARAVEGGLALGLLLSVAVTLNFAFDRLDWQWDLAFFKTAEPSDATLELAEGLEDKTQVALFFPEDHLVLSQLRGYFDALQDVTDKLEIKTYDAELSPLQAKAFKVRQNGAVLLRKGSVNRKIQVGTDLARARARVGKFDGDFFKALLEVSRERQTAYLTVGHGERNERKANRLDPRSGVRVLRKLLAERNFKVKNLGASEGLATSVPADAHLVIVLAPANAFLPGEVAALTAYLKRGGRLLILLDPETGGAGPSEAPNAGAASLAPLLAAHGIRYDPIIQVNDRYYARRTFTKADRGLLVTIAYQSHPSVAALRRQPKNNPLLLLGSGVLSKGKAPPQLRVQETVLGMKGTWGDENRNYEFEQGKEARAQPIMSLAVSPLPARKGRGGGKTKAGPRMIAFADADFALDFLMQNRANRLVVLEAITWLAGGKLPSGLTAKEQDVKLLHAKSDEWIWFYLPVFCVPLLVLALGYLFSGRPGMRRRE